MKRKPIFWILAIAMAGTLVYLGLRPRPIEVDLGTVTRGPLVVTVNEDGETRIREPYLISAPLAGRLLRVTLEPGDVLESKQVVSAIDPSDPGLLDARSAAEAEARANAAQAAFTRAETQLELAKADTEQAQRYYDRDLGRLERENISEATLEDTEHALRISRGNLAAAQSTVEIARFEMEQAKAALLYSQSLSDEEAPSNGRNFEIHSPIDGVVLRRFQESSTVVPAGERILEIGDPKDLEVRIDVLSQDAVRIRPGQRIIIEHWGGTQNLIAWVRRVEPSAFTKVSALGVDEQRVWVYGDLDRAQPEPSPEAAEVMGDSLGDAYRIEARIVVWERDEVTKVPAGALFRDSREGKDSWAVFLQSGGDLCQKVAIEIGERNDQEAEVLSGLQPGNRVVLHPSDKVEDGVLLKERTL